MHILICPDSHDESQVEKTLGTRFGFVVTSQELDFPEMILVFLRILAAVNLL